MSRDKEGFTFGNVFMAFLGGAAVGSAIAYFMAPRAGAESRRLAGEALHEKKAHIEAAARNGKESISRIPPAIRHAYSAGADAAKEAFTEAYKEGGRSGSMTDALSASPMDSKA